MNNYDWRISVTATGDRDGWYRTVVDTPTFELHSNAQFGGIHTRDGAASVAADMFLQLLRPGDMIHVTVTPVDPDSHDEPSMYRWLVRDDGIGQLERIPVDDDRYTGISRRIAVAGD